MAVDSQTRATDFVITRQPVFDRGLQPWGTAVGQLVYLDDPISCDDIVASIMVEAHLPRRGPSDARTIVSFTASAILEGMPRYLSSQNMIVEVEETAAETSSIRETVAELKQAGYGIAVGGFRNRSAFHDLTRIADVVIIDSSELGIRDDEVALRELVQSARQFGAKVQIRGLTRWRHMLQARIASADLFQGFFFNNMSFQQSGKSITVTQLSRLRLLECLDKPDADFMALARVVEADAPLTYRLLVFLNSASFGLARKVDSVQQAVVLAGWKPLKNWLRIVLLTDLSSSPRHQELCYYAAQRADFLRRVAKTAGAERLAPTLSLLGLLSYIEPILEMPAASALANVPVADAIRQALCGEKSPLSPWLALVQAIENANLDHVGRLAKSAGLSTADLARCYHESFTAADVLFGILPTPQFSSPNTKEKQ